jgi:ABC-type amino acid transport substrate-binding protein
VGFEGEDSMRKQLALLYISLILVLIVSPSAYAIDQTIPWTEDEIAFTKQHPIIRLGVDPGFLPFEFLDIDGEYKGIAADYLSLISEKTGIQFEMVKGLNWPQAYERALIGDIDVLPAVSKTEEREQYFVFSDPYYHVKRVIVTRDTEKAISGIEDLDGMTVAVQRNSSHHSYLRSYPNINLSLYDSVAVALTDVANGTERAYVGNLATTNYFLRANGLTNLKFIAFEAEKQLDLCFAIRKDWPELVSILNKALATITEEEKITINNKWINLETETDYGDFIRVIVIIGGFVGIVLAVSFYWILRLRNEIKKRKLILIALEKAKQEAEDANEFKSNFLARRYERRSMQLQGWHIC